VNTIARGAIFSGVSVGAVIVLMLGMIAFQDVPEMIVETENSCEIAGGLWGIWGNRAPATASCNPSTSDVGMECSDSSQCQSFCQAKEGSEINSETTGMCYGYELAICMQEVLNGVVQHEWCQ